MRKLTLTAILGVITLIAALGLADAAVYTDQADYAPGSTVSITGDGMLGGEQVEVEVFYPDGSLAQSHTVTADGAGNFSDTYVLPGDEIAVTGTYTVVATGVSSGRIFSTTFDDGHHVEAFYPANTTDTHTSAATRAALGSVHEGDSLTVTFRLFWHIVGGDSSDTTVDVDLLISSQDNGATIGSWISFSPDPALSVGGGTVHSTSGGSNVDMTISPPCGTTPGTYNGRAQGSHNAGASSEFWFSFIVTADTCGGGGATSEVTTKIHLEPGHTDVTGGTVTFGAVIHDEATVTITGGIIPGGSSVTFRRFPSGDCSGTGVDEVVNLTGGSASEVVESSSYTTTIADIYNSGVSYKAKFTSGNPGTVPSTDFDDVDCEELTVASSITGFSYRDTDQAGPFRCHSLNGGPPIVVNDANAASGYTTPGTGTCPAGTFSTTTLNSANTFTVTITVTNNTGYAIDEKVQGGLAANGSAYSILEVGGCGTATFTGLDGGKGSKAKGNANGNVITWTISSLADGESCTLVVRFAKSYSATGLQPVTSSWSECQKPAGAGGSCDKSPYTGELLTDVVAP